MTFTLELLFILTWITHNLQVTINLRNKSNLRDLIAATGLVILLKLESNHLFSAHMTLICDGWPWKTIGQHFYAMSSLVHNFKVIDEFKLELTVQKRPIWELFLSHVTLRFDGWPWKTIGHLFYATSSFSLHFEAISEFKLEILFSKLSIQVKIGDFLSHRAPLLCHFKLCPSFHSHWYLTACRVIEKKFLVSSQDRRLLLSKS